MTHIARYPSTAVDRGMLRCSYPIAHLGSGASSRLRRVRTRKWCPEVGFAVAYKDRELVAEYLNSAVRMKLALVLSRIHCIAPQPALFT